MNVFLRILHYLNQSQVNKTIEQLIKMGGIVAAFLFSANAINKLFMNAEQKVFTGLLTAGMRPALALLVTAQGKHETAVGGIPYLSHQYLINNNCFGYGYIPTSPYQVFGGGGKHPEDSGIYAKFLSVENSVKEQAAYYNRHKSTFANVSNPAQLVAALVAARYFTDPPKNYLSGVTKFYKTQKQILNV